VQQSSARPGIRTPIVLLVLALFAVTGLGAGMLVRTALAGIGVHLTGTATTSAPVGSPATHPATPSPSPSVTVPAELAPSGFKLSASASPRVVAPGQSLVVTVAATAGNGAPQPGVACYLDAADPSSAGLLPVEPSTAVTSSDGSASWTLTVPQVAAGSYSLRVHANGQHGWEYHVFVTITVRA